MGCGRSPTKAAFVASRYGPRPGRRTGEVRFHAGLDFRAPSGTPVFAPADGIVETLVGNDGSLSTSVPRGVRAGPFRGYGNVLVLRLPGPVWMSFNHLRSFAPGLRAGARVRKGAFIGLVGNTNNGKFPGMGAHLHLETRHSPTSSALTPFPGPYGRWNFDPVDWFERHGLVLDGRQLVKTSECVPAVRTSGGTSKGLGALPRAVDVPWKAIADSKDKAPPGTEYEPPRKFSPSLGVVALVIGGGIGMMGLGLGIYRGTIAIPFANRVVGPAFGSVPDGLFNQISREQSDAKKFIELEDPDCNESYLRLANGYRLLLRANAMSSMKSEDKRIDRFATKFDKLANTIDSWCKNDS